MMKYCNMPDMYQFYDKPVYSYNALIMMAMKDSPRGMLTFSEICDYIQAKYPYYQHKINDGWQKPLRAQLTCGKCYVLVPGQQHKHKNKWEQYWMFNPDCPEICVSRSTGRLVTKRRNRSEFSPKAQEAISIGEMQQFSSQNLEGFKDPELQYASRQMQDCLEAATKSTCTRVYKKKEIFSINENSSDDLQTELNSDYRPRSYSPRSPLVDSRAEEAISMGGFQFHPFPFHQEAGLADSGLREKEFFSSNGDSLDDLQAVLEEQPDYL